MLLAVDPGIDACGCALFIGTRLVRALLVRSTASGHAAEDERVKCMCIAVQDAFPDATRLVVERPVSYTRRDQQKGPQDDLILVAQVVGGLLLRFGIPSATYKPFEWKRQMPKPICRRRVEKRLEPVELAGIELPAKSLQHNVFDAIGIGLHHVGRVLY